jgi:hypothetical protein
MQDNVVEEDRKAGKDMVVLTTRLERSEEDGFQNVKVVSGCMS